MSSERRRQSRSRQRSHRSRSTGISRERSRSPSSMRRVHPEESSENSRDRRSSRRRRSSNDPTSSQEQGNTSGTNAGPSDSRARRTSDRPRSSPQSDGQSWPVNADGEPRSPFARKMDQDIARQCFSGSSEADVNQQYQRRQEDLQPGNKLPEQRRSSDTQPSNARSGAYDSEVVLLDKRDRSRSVDQAESKYIGQFDSQPEGQDSQEPDKCPKDWFICNLVLLVVMGISIVIAVVFTLQNNKNGISNKTSSKYT